jgi:hypothetical protein
MSSVLLRASILTVMPRDQTIAVWGMKCVGYDLKFERHLASSLGAIGKTPTPSEPVNKRKAVARGDSSMGEGDGEGSESEEFAPPKRQQIGKGKAKLMESDWPDARLHSDNDDS